jgi:hypothetical protein
MASTQRVPQWEDWDMLADHPLAVQAVTITCQVTHAPWYHLPVGIFAVLTGLAAAVMSLREKSSWKWKGAWLFAIFLLTAAELRMIVWSDSDAAEERAYAACENQQQFQNTMSGVGQVFDKTKLAADTATQAVKEITGGDSWGWVSLIPFRNNPNKFYFSVSNEGKKYALRGVRLAVLDETDMSNPLRMKQCDIGDIPPHTGYSAPFTDSCNITLNPLIKDHLLIIVGALNGGTYEDLFITASPNGPVQSYEVYKVFSDGKRKILKKFGLQSP